MFVLFPGIAGADVSTDAPSNETRVVVDDTAHMIRFIIQGREQAVLDANGLHVRGNIGFTGYLADHGEQGYPELQEERLGGAGAE